MSGTASEPLAAAPAAAAAAGEKKHGLRERLQNPEGALRLGGAGRGGRSRRRDEHGPPLTERLRQHLLLGRRALDAALLAQLLLRRVRPGGPRHDRQAAAGALAPGGQREAVRLPPAQRAAAGGAGRGGGGRGPLLGRHQALRRPRRSDSGPRVRAVPLLRRGVAHEQRRRPADPADAARLRGGDPRVRIRALAHAAPLRPARRPRLQHEDARRVPGRARDRARLPPLRARERAQAHPPAARRRRPRGRRLLRVDRGRRSDAGVAAALRRQLDRQHRAGPDLQLQRLRARRRTGRRARRDPRQARRPRADLPRPPRGRAARPRTPPAPAAAARSPRRAIGEHRPLPETDRLRGVAQPAAAVRRRPGRPGRLDPAVRLLRPDRGARAAVARAARTATGG